MKKNGYVILAATVAVLVVVFDLLLCLLPNGGTLWGALMLVCLLAFVVSTAKIIKQ